MFNDLSGTISGNSAKSIKDIGLESTRSKTKGSSSTIKSTRIMANGDTDKIEDTMGNGVHSDGQYVK